MVRKARTVRARDRVLVRCRRLKGRRPFGLSRLARREASFSRLGGLEYGIVLEIPTVSSPSSVSDCRPRRGDGDGHLLGRAPTPDSRPNRRMATVGADSSRWLLRPRRIAASNTRAAHPSSKSTPLPMGSSHSRSSARKPPTPIVWSTRRTPAARDATAGSSILFSR